MFSLVRAVFRRLFRRGYVIKTMEILEMSIVSLPSNPDCVMKETEPDG